MRFRLLMGRALAAFGMLSLLLIVFSFLGVFFAGQWLKGSDQLVKADAMIVLAGAPERAMYAADLFGQGYAPTIYVSRPAREFSHRRLEEFGIVLPTEEFVNRTILNKRGVDNKYIQVFSRGSINTLDEARSLRAALPQEVKTLMIVTSPYHVRRVKLVFGDVFRESGVSVWVVANPYEVFPDHWWTEQDAARQTVLEVIKIVFYQLGGSFSRSKQ